MKYEDFYIGLEFFTGGGKWRCTDIGTRVIVAISLEPRRRVTVAYDESIVKLRLTKCEIAQHKMLKRRNDHNILRCCQGVIP